MMNGNDDVDTFFVLVYSHDKNRPCWFLWG
jgi:hypothetical protein